MYCLNCKKQINTEHSFCPDCGSRLVGNEQIASATMTQECTDDYRPNGGYIPSEKEKKRGIRFNFSKPLCLLFSLLLFATFLLPIIKLSFGLDGRAIFNNKPIGIFELQPFVADCYKTVMRFISLAPADAANVSEVMWLVNGILLLVTLYFMIAALHILLFGIIGLFTKGRFRYYLARVGSTMYFIGLVVLIAAVFIGGGKLKTLVGGLSDSYGMNLSAALIPTAYLFIAAAFALIFRIFGIRLLRLLNGTSCANRGYDEIARREFKKLGRRFKSSTPQAQTEYAKPASVDIASDF